MPEEGIKENTRAGASTHQVLLQLGMCVCLRGFTLLIPRINSRCGASGNFSTPFPYVQSAPEVADLPAEGTDLAAEPTAWLLRQLRPVSFTRSASGSRSYGFIAQESPRSPDCKMETQASLADACKLQFSFLTSVRSD